MDKFLIRKKEEKNDENEGKKSAPTKLVTKKRKYLEEYLEYGFIASEKDELLPFCLMCSTTLSNESMNPSKLKRHLETKHPDHKNKPIIFFETLRSDLQKQSKKLKKFTAVSDQAQFASFKIAQLLAKKKKSHAEAENVIMPALKIAAECMLTNEAVEKFKNIPLSSKTIARKIQCMSEDIESQMRGIFNDSKDGIYKFWAIQLDESTDISGKAQLLSFLRFIRDGRIVNEYFFCRELHSTTTGKDIFELVDDSVKKFGLNWENCVSVCTDGAPAMQGRKKGFVSHVLRQNGNVEIVHCMIHREVLVSKSLQPELSATLMQVVKVVNYIKGNHLRSRIFAALCEAMDSDYKCLLYHTEVRWLSKGKVLHRFVYLRAEIISFIDEENVNFEFLRDEIWWLKVSFLSDLFDKINHVNLSLQGAEENFITITGKMKSFYEKLGLWKSKIISSKFDTFPTVDVNPLKMEIKKEIEETLESLSQSFLKYFPRLDVSKTEWVINPFMRCDTTNLDSEEEESLIDLRNELVYKRLFAEKELSEFWISLKDQYPRLSKKAIQLILPFGSSYLCETGFSALTEMKSKKRERLQMIDEEMRVCLSSIEPRINLISAQKQSQVSH